MTMRGRQKGRVGSDEGEAGMTLIEVMIAAMVLVLGAAATFGVLSAATKNAQRAKSSQIALDLAQEEMERMRSLPYDALAISEAPTPETDPLSPNSRVTGGSFALQRQPPGEYEPLVIDPNGISPESSFSSGNPEGEGGVTGTVYRYVVWRRLRGWAGLQAARRRGAARRGRRAARRARLRRSPVRLRRSGRAAGTAAAKR
jgi:type II secretory pathway pseudopilin PulG